MAFVLLHVRYRDHDQCPVMILSSHSHEFQATHTETSARTYITNCSSNSDEPYFVVFFGRDDLPRDAYAVRQGKWRNLDMRKTEPRAHPGSSNLYSGEQAVSPYLVIRW